MLMRMTLLALLAGCQAPSRPVVPVADQHCPEAAEAPPRLPAIVPPEALRTLYWRERAARIETTAALAECAERLAKVLEIIKP